MERTLVIIKPDAVQRGLIGQIITRIEQRGLKIIALKMMRVSTELARRHYAVHAGKDFYEPLISFITAAPVVVMVLEAPGAIQLTRRTVGATRPNDARPGTIRGDFAMAVSHNLIHASDAPATAAYEIPLFFTAAEINSWERSTDHWLYEQ